METLFILIPLSLVLAVIIGGAFWWSVNSGQFEDLEQHGGQIVRDNDRSDSSETTPSKLDLGQ